MSTPAPDEIPTTDQVANALATLRCIPGTTDTTTIGHIEKANAPTYRIARALRRYLEEECDLDIDDIPSTSDLRYALSRAIVDHNLCITTDTDPGQLIGYQHLEADGRQTYNASDDGLRHVDAACWYGPTVDGRRAALTDAKDESLLAVAVYLLPKSDQS